MADRIEPAQPIRAADEHVAEARLPLGVAVTAKGSHRAEASPHSQKFRAVTALLVGLAIGAIVVAIAIASSKSNRGAQLPWSSWSPPDGGLSGAREIADHIAPLYRITGIDQLAVVTVLNLSNPNSIAAQDAASGQASGVQIAVRTNSSGSGLSVLGGDTIAYNLCGIGSTNCAIGVGTPSSQRLLLLRREALELALYTFRYISGIQQVVAILPPGRTTQTSKLSAKPPSSNATSTPLDIAVLFVRSELQPWLQQPLSETLPEQFPPTVDQMPNAPEAPLVEQITARGLFDEHMEQAQDGSSLIVLNPLPPQ